MPSQQTDNQTKERLTKRILANSRILCWVSAVFPLLALLGWIFNINVFRQVYPGLPVMRTNTAFGLLLITIAILLTGRKRRSRKATVAACGLGVVVLLLGLLTLSEYFSGVDFGIDRLFFGHAVMPPGPYPGRPSPQTSANFILFGAALLAYNLRSLPIRPGQTFVLMAGANASIVSTAYILGTSQFHGFPMLGTGMAVHSAAAFILLAVALLLSRPDDGMMSLVTSGTRSGAMARQILFTGMAAPLVIGILTRVGVVAGWYSASAQISLFVVMIIALVLRRTWQLQGNRNRMSLWRARLSRSLRPQTRGFAKRRSDWSSPSAAQTLERGIGMSGPVRAYSTRGGLRFVVFAWKKSGLTWTHGFRACIPMIGRAYKKHWRIIFRVLPRSITPSFARRRNPATGSGSSPGEKCLRGMRRGSRTAWSESRPTSANESASKMNRGSLQKSERCSAPVWISTRRWRTLHDWRSVISRTSASSISTRKVVAVDC